MVVATTCKGTNGKVARLASLPVPHLQGLTSLVREGSPLHTPVLGSLAGVALEARRAWLNAGYFARGELPLAGDQGWGAVVGKQQGRIDTPRSCAVGQTP